MCGSVSRYGSAAHSLGLKYQAAPLLWHSGFRNIPAGQMRHRALIEHARALQAEAGDLLAGANYEVDSLHVPERARHRDCSVHDCECPALAARLGVKVVTMDAKLLRAFPKHAIAMTLR